MARIFHKGGLQTPNYIEEPIAYSIFECNQCCYDLDFGVSHQGLMIGLEVSDVLYLKTDVTNLPVFVQRELSPFMYDKGEKKLRISYSQAPDEALDDPFEMNIWARPAYNAALRSNKGKTSKK